MGLYAIYIISTNLNVCCLRGHEAAVLCVRFDSSKIVSGSCDKTIKVQSLHFASRDNVIDNAVNLAVAIKCFRLSGRLDLILPVSKYWTAKFVFFKIIIFAYVIYLFFNNTLYKMFILKCIRKRPILLLQ